MASDIPSAFSATLDLGNFFSARVWRNVASSMSLVCLSMVSCVMLTCTFRNCLASRQPVLLATLRNMSSLSDHQIILQICKGLGYGRSDEARVCPMCPHESPYLSHAEFACSIRIEAVRTMSRIFRCIFLSLFLHDQVLIFSSIVFEPSCERSAGASDAITLSALETALFRDLPALLSTVLLSQHFSCCLMFLFLHACCSVFSHQLLQLLVKELHEADCSTRLLR